MYDELIARIRYHIRKADFMGLKEYESTRLLNEAADAIEGLSHAVDQMTEWRKNRWIPVTERLPKENGFYLCLYKHKASGGVAMDEGLSILQWINNKWGIIDIYLVTHWMPLPEPPKDGEA